MNDGWKDFWGLGFFGAGQRRGARVSPLKIGSRDGEIVFGGIYGFYAVLRRELRRGNWVLLFFGILAGDPRGLVEEGGRFVFPLVHWGNLIVSVGGVL
jgi:hypothetical protein